VVVFEDLHWIDAETQAFLDHLAQGVPTAAVLLAVNFRPEYQHAWAGRTYYRQLRGRRLPARSAAERSGIVGPGEHPTGSCASIPCRPAAPPSSWASCSEAMRAWRRSSRC